MKICLVINSLARGGGAERVASELANYWISKSHEVEVIILDRKVEYSLNEKVVVTSLLPENKLIKSYIKPFIQLKKLHKIFKKNENDLIISFLFRANIISIISSIFTENKMIISERSFSKENYSESSLIKFVIKKIYPRACKIIAISNSVKESLMKDFEIPEMKIEVISNPVNISKIKEQSTEEFDINRYFCSFKESDLNIVSVGRLIELKNFEFLINTVSKLLDKKYNINLLIIGEGPNEPILNQLIKEKGLEKNVILYGYTSNPFKIMKNFDVFISASTYEAFGNAVLEAMSLGIPVMALKGNGGPNEILKQGEYGVIYNNDIDLVENLIKFIKEEGVLKKYSCLSLNRAKNHSLESISNKYLNIKE
ncbi:glycosyltransferase [Planococcus kocurii]|uniref:glycosyltransferase n=1 Tax=Planococcus kocurii TaxID=1374 RepID=UPI003D08B1FB